MPNVVRMESAITCDTFDIPQDTPPEVLSIARALNDDGYGCQAVGAMKGGIFMILVKKQDQEPIMVSISVPQKLGMEQ